MSSIACLPRSILLLAFAGLVPCVAAGQGLTGALIGTVRDEQGGVLAGGTCHGQSSALIGPATLTTTERGQLRFAALPPGLYTLVVEMPGLATWRERAHRHRCRGDDRAKRPCCGWRVSQSRW